MKALSDSYVKTLELLKANKPEEASKEFTENFVAVVKKLFSETENTYPPKFSKNSDCWCTWVKELYKITVTTDKILKKNEVENATKMLSTLREHFYKLHIQTKTEKTNDYIYAFYVGANKDTQDLKELKSIQEELDKAELSVKAKAQEEDYKKAKSEWLSKVSELLKADTIAPEALTSLRQVTEKFYNEFGIQFE